MTSDTTNDRPAGNAMPVADTAPALGLRPMLRGLALDVALPLVVYYGLYLLGAGDWTALLAAGGVAGARIVWAAVRERSLNPFATVMLIVLGLGMGLALVSGDPRFLLLKNSVVTGAVGLVFLATTRWGRPLTLSATQSFMRGRSAGVLEAYRTDPHVRRSFQLDSTVWGTGLLVEAFARVPLIYLLPIPVVVGVSEAMTIAAFSALMTWNVWYARRGLAARARRMAADRQAAPMDTS